MSPVSLPKTTLTLIGESALIPVSEQKVLFVGQMLDAEYSSTIASAEADSGETKFNFSSGPEVKVGQFVTISGYTGSAIIYNGTHLVTKVTTTTFNIAVTFDSTQTTGSFVNAFTAGTATPGALVETIGTAGQEDALFGAHSLIAGMIRAARRVNTETQFDAIALTDGTSASVVNATGVVTFTGTATESGTIDIHVGSSTNHIYEVAVASADTASEVGDALVLLINADGDAPFIAANVAGVVTITSIHTGETANSFLLRHLTDVAGVTVALTAWTGGTVNPTLTGLFDPIETIRYQTIVYPGAYATATLTSFLNPRFNVTNNVLDGVGIMTATDTLTNLKAAGLALDTASAVLLGNNIVSRAGEYLGSHIAEMNDNVSSYMAAIRSLRLTEGANLSDVVVTTIGPADLFGGPELSTLPYMNSPYDFLEVSVAGDEWTADETTELEQSGVSIIGPNTTRNGMISGEIFSTATTDGAGNPDSSWHFLNTVDASSAGREFQVINLKSRYKQTRLTDNDLVDDRSETNANAIRAFVLTMYQELADQSIYQKGSTPYTSFNESLVVETELTSGEGLATITESPLLVGQLRTIQGTIQVNFGNNV